MFCYRFSFFLFFTWVVGWCGIIFSFPQKSRGCITSLLKEASVVSEFNRLFAKSFSEYPVLDSRLEEILRQKIIRFQGKLRPEIVNRVKRGESPLMFSPVIEAVVGVYARLVESELKDEKEKERVLRVLYKARRELMASVPRLERGVLTRGSPTLLAFGGSGLGSSNLFGGGDGRGDDAFYWLGPEISRYLYSARLSRCIVRASILFTVSTFITAIGALEAKWAKYAMSDQRLWQQWAKLGERDVWLRAVRDPDFRHNMVWNSILMVSLGAFTCLKNRDLGKKMMTAMALATSVAGQFFSNGFFSLRQTLIDVLYVRFISLNKSKLAFRLAENYRRSQLALPFVIESSLQFLSEGFGAFTYPRLVALSRWLFNDPVSSSDVVDISSGSDSE